MARRNQIPPYEIMRHGSGAKGIGVSSSGVADDAEQDESQSSLEGVGDARRGKAPWWVGSASPLVLRLPRGVAVAVVAGIFLVVVMAYWVGKSRGQSIEKDAQKQAQTIGTRVGSPRPGGIYISQAGETDGGGGSQPSTVQTYREEKRENGLNYFRLATTDVEEGTLLAEFMAAAGIDIQLVIDENKGRCVVYVVERGFRPNELSSDARRDLESRLLSLGRLWKQQRSGNNDFTSMQPEKYTGG